MAEAIFKSIARYAKQYGKKKAIEEYGDKEVKKAQDSLRRQAEKNRQSRLKDEQSSSEEAIKTPTSIIKARKVPVDEGSSDLRREKLIQERKKSSFDETSVYPEGMSTAKKQRTVSRKKARKLIEEKTGETRKELNRRLEKEAYQMGVKSGEGPAEKAAPQYDLTQEQASDALRGKYNVDVEDSEPDLIEMLEKLSKKDSGYKKGGKISRPRGVGKALRGYGKALKG
jgi:hypothetical protein